MKRSQVTLIELVRFCVKMAERRRRGCGSFYSFNCAVNRQVILLTTSATGPSPGTDANQDGFYYETTNKLLSNSKSYKLYKLPCALTHVLDQLESGGIFLFSRARTAQGPRMDG